MCCVSSCNATQVTVSATSGSSGPGLSIQISIVQIQIYLHILLRKSHPVPAVKSTSDVCACVGRETLIMAMSYQVRAAAAIGEEGVQK